MYLQFILKHILKYARFLARLIPHILADDQKRVRVQPAKQLVEMFPTSNQGQLQILLLMTKRGSYAKKLKKYHKLRPVRI